jgi:hypothetical protein
MLSLRMLLCLLLLCEVYNAQTINTFAGVGTPGYSGDGGSATLAQLNRPASIAVDAYCNVYFTDGSNHVIRKINSAGVISTIAGNGTGGYSGDGGPATSAQLFYPQHLALDALGNIYVCDTYNARIRKINTSGIITTICGNGFIGFTGDGGPAVNAQLFMPRGIAVDGTNNIYISDSYNYRIRIINTSGIINTFAGTSWGNSGDGGPAVSAKLGGPCGITFDGIGNLYFSDVDYHVVRKINGSGIITTIAGNGTLGFSGDGGTATNAQLYWPMDVAVDASGNIYIADEYNHRVRQVNTLGVINTFAGIGTPGFSGDGGLAISAQMNKPSGIKIDAAGNFYIPDSLNHRIRIIGSNSCVTGIKTAIQEEMKFVYPNPTKDITNLNLNEHFIGGTIQLYDAIGKLIQTQQIKNTTEKINLNLNSGIYFVKATTKEGVSKTEKLVIE